MSARPVEVVTALLSDHDAAARLCDEAAANFREQGSRLFNGRATADLVENADLLVAALEVLLQSARELRQRVGELE